MQNTNFSPGSEGLPETSFKIYVRILRASFSLEETTPLYIGRLAESFLSTAFSIASLPRMIKEPSSSLTKVFPARPFSIILVAMGVVGLMT